MNHRSIVYSLTLLLVLAIARPVFSWNETGHRLVAMVAWEQMTEETREAVLEMLNDHPKRNSKAFRTRTHERVREEDEPLWLFLQSSIWPDRVRKSSDDRPNWHYINEPLFVSKSDRDHFSDGVPVNRETSWDESMYDKKDLNVVQALHQCMHALQNSDLDRKQKAKYLCWMVHLVGDIHQPLHSTALFSKRVLPKGDHGGNWIPTSPKSNLHSFWDNAAGRGKSIDGLRYKVKRWLRDDELRDQGEQATEVLDFDVWVNESYELAWSHVYVEEILEAAARGTAGTGRRAKPRIKKVTLTDDYIDNAKEVAKERVVEAGYRLGAILNQLEL